VNSFMLSAGVRWTTLDSSQPSFTLPHNPSIPILNRHKSLWHLPFEFHTGAVPVVLKDNYHKVLTTTSTTQGYSYHPETHGRHQFVSYFTPPLAFSAHYIIISVHSPDNVNRLDPVLNVPEYILNLNPCNFCTNGPLPVKVINSHATFLLFETS